MPMSLNMIFSLVGVAGFILISLHMFGHVEASGDDYVVKMGISSPVRKVHIVFMNHLDVGYYDGLDQDVGFAVQVLNRYQTEYFTRAINLSRTLIQRGYTERFIYTTHPWLVSLYVDCPNIKLLNVSLKCPNKTEVMEFEKAVNDGLIAWHAVPMNIQTDFLGAKLFEYGLDLSKSLDDRFGIKRTHATMSQRDIPGMTKALLPLLVSRKVKAISVGVNPGTAPPAVPSPFVWKLRESDKDGVLAFWVKGGYPLNPGPYPAKPRGLARDKCITADGIDQILCFAFRTDNTGPPASVEELLGFYEILRSEFPDAHLVASTFDNFVQVLDTVRSSLPVRIFEIGDTWIQGATTDPKKYSMYRAFVRAWENCTSQGKCSNQDPAIAAMLRYLIKLPEHTWGAHDFLDHMNWTNAQLAKARTSKMYHLAEDSWREQRQFLDFAFDALGDHPLRQMVQTEYDQLKPVVPDLTGFSPASVGEDILCPLSKFVFKVGADGSLIRLFDPLNQREWASSDNPVGQLIYDTYIETDFEHMAKLYNYEAGVGYDKPNVTKYAHPEKRRWKFGVSHIYKKITGSSCQLWVEAMTTDNQTRTKYGAPDKFYVGYTMTTDSPTDVDVTLLMFGKVTTRLPESISFGFTPKVSQPSWQLSKMGQLIDPCNVVLNGSQYVHGVDSGIQVSDNGAKLEILTKDVPVVFIGTTDHVDSPFPVPLQPLECSSIRTMSYNIYNNIWNTNFIYWYPYNPEDAHFKARFKLRMTH